MATEYPERFRTGGQNNSVVGALLDSAIAGDRVVITNLIHHITGTGEITMMTPPWAGFGGVVYLVPDGACTGALGGSTNGFAKVWTAVALRAIGFVYNPVTDLWYPMA